jgi:signal transduction histidine kinase
MSDSPSTSNQGEGIEPHPPLVATRQALVELQAFHSRISVLQEIALAITRQLSLAEILQEVGQQVKWLLDFDHCSVCLNETDGANLVTLFDLSNTGVSLDLVKTVIQTKQPQLISDAAAFLGNLSSYRSQLIIPLESEGQILGTINFTSRRPQTYRLEDLRVGNLLAMQLSAAIRNARQFEEITRLYAQLERTYDDLRHAESLRHDLTNMIVHDLRNPLGVVLGSLELELLIHRADQPDKQRYLNNALEATQYIINMVDDLLDMTKMDNQELSLSLAPLCLAELVREKEKFYRVQAEKEKKRFTTYIPVNLPEVIADRRLISRVIDNLITNALKYTRPGGHIEIRVEQKEQALWVHTLDDGEGIPLEYQQRIFEKFFQVIGPDGTPVRKGTGLGLTFCRLAVEAHKGRIWVESNLGQGSTFVFTLPLNYVE